MTVLDTTWRKSSKSGGNGNCVEVRFAAGSVEVRDTKDRDGALLAFSPDAWNAFITAVKQREFDHNA